MGWLRGGVGLKGKTPFNEAPALNKHGGGDRCTVSGEGREGRETCALVPLRKLKSKLLQLRRFL